MTETADASVPMARRIAGQGAILFSGFAAAQMMSFARNAILGHTLAKGDFGIAATLTMLLQLLDSLTDIGADRLIVQAPDGAAPRFVATQHGALILRGLLTSAVLLALSGPIAGFFNVPDAAWGFAVVALVPAIKGLQSLGPRLSQRGFDNRPFLAVEIVPQTIALMATIPIVRAYPDFSAVVWLALIQAAAAVVTSHAATTCRYRIAFDRAILMRLVRFGWPIWLSAFPLVAVFHGDRIAIGRLIGMEELAGYTAAFMIAMVPGVIAAKVGHALMLPVFAGARGQPGLLSARLAAMTEATAIIASVYLATALLLGGVILEVAFGPNYRGLGGVVGCLALMWSVRMLQAVPGMALMAEGETRPFLVAGLIRATALIPATLLAAQGHGLVAVAACGVAGELASLAYVTVRLGASDARLSGVFCLRALFLAPAALISGAALLTTSDPVPRALALGAVVLMIGALALVIFPRTRGHLRTLAASRAA